MCCLEVLISSISCQEITDFSRENILQLGCISTIVQKALYHVSMQQLSSTEWELDIEEEEHSMHPASCTLGKHMTTLPRGAHFNVVHFNAAVWQSRLSLAVV